MFLVRNIGLIESLSHCSRVFRLEWQCSWETLGCFEASMKGRAAELGVKADGVTGKVLMISKIEGARRQVDEAMKALERGDFDIAITLAGAAEGMLETTDLSAPCAKRPRPQVWKTPAMLWAG
jgi:hypothetical protein